MSDSFIIMFFLSVQLVFIFFFTSISVRVLLMHYWQIEYVIMFQFAFFNVWSQINLTNVCSLLFPSSCFLFIYTCYSLLNVFTPGLGMSFTDCRYITGGHINRFKKVSLSLRGNLCNHNQLNKCLAETEHANKCSCIESRCHSRCQNSLKCQLLQ